MNIPPTRSPPQAVLDYGQQWYGAKSRSSLCLLDPEIPQAYLNAYLAAQQSLADIPDSIESPSWGNQNDMVMENWMDPTGLPAINWDFPIMDNNEISFMSPALAPGVFSNQFPLQLPQPMPLPPTMAPNVQMPFSSDIGSPAAVPYSSEFSDTLSPNTLPIELNASERLQRWIQQMRQKQYRMDDAPLTFTPYDFGQQIPTLLPSIWTKIFQLVKYGERPAKTEDVCRSFRTWTRDALQEIVKEQERRQQRDNMITSRYLRYLMCEGRDIIEEIPWFMWKMKHAPKWREGWQSGLTMSWSSDCMIKTEGRTRSQNCRMCQELWRMPPPNAGL